MPHFPIFTFWSIENGTPEAITQLLASLDINPDEIEDEKVCRHLFAFCLIVIEEQSRERLNPSRSENQKLRDEINLLKGEQTKPKIRGSKKNEDISSETERYKRRCI